MMDGTRLKEVRGDLTLAPVVGAETVLIGVINVSCSKGESERGWTRFEGRDFSRHRPLCGPLPLKTVFS